MHGDFKQAKTAGAERPSRRDEQLSQKEFSAAVAELTGSWGGVAAQVDAAQGLASVQLKRYISYGVYAVIALVCAVGALGLAGAAWRKTCLLDGGSALGVLVVWLFSAAVGVQLAASVGIADFCVAPNNSTVLKSSSSR